jgi:hypothetical protein
MNFKSVDVIAANILFPTNENNITIAMLIKLFATKSVARSFLGFSKSFEIIFPLELCSCNVSSTSFCDNENKATSAPEIKAEQNSKTTIPVMPTATLASTA